MILTQEIISALNAKYTAQKLEANTNLINYFNNPSGIGEHPNIVGEVDKLISQIAEAQGKMDIVETIVKLINESSNNR